MSEGAEPYVPRAEWEDRPDHVQAAGGVVWRVEGDEVQVLLVHRPRYDDWSLPKGKLDPGEEHEAGAAREVEEETGYRPVLGHELVCTRYVDGRGRPKTVRYWEMTVAEGDFQPNHETDAIRWLSVDEARDLLTYERDQPVLDSFAAFVAGR